MAGMLQILTYLLSFYLVLKGVEILQIGLSSSRTNRKGLIAIGVASLILCISAAVGFSAMQDDQAKSLQHNMPQ
ncbi:hypothetical protein NKW53_11995 [Acetobacter orientalis]|uniref:hypothetical protein n=1 Tax=Acetobacter orientalis TaxID=146474 RepID=UPI0020A16C1B|nr:hypothetical protein [Acetobacter orientalis]MCP1216787.1 hypothetical protein [Acetobacter orientalis]MCP1219514.1 hypothetical protein [Acetobacter orientalis]